MKIIVTIFVIVQNFRLKRLSLPESKQQQVPKAPKESLGLSPKMEKTFRNFSCSQQSCFLDHFKSDGNFKLSRVFIIILIIAIIIDNN